MFNVLVKLDILGQLVHIAVNPDSDIPAFYGTLEYLGMFTFTPSDNRCQELDLRSLGKCHYGIGHLVHALTLYLLAAVRTVRNSYPCIQKP